MTPTTFPQNLEKVTYFISMIINIIFLGTSLILNDPRFNIDLDRKDSTYTLRIEDIQETDGAIYQCQVIISLTEKEIADVPLIVRRPPVISDNSTRDPIIYFIEGRSPSRHK